MAPIPAQSAVVTNHRHTVTLSTPLRQESDRNPATPGIRCAYRTPTTADRDSYGAVMPDLAASSKGPIKLLV